MSSKKVAEFNPDFQTTHQAVIARISTLGRAELQARFAWPPGTVNALATKTTKKSGAAFTTETHSQQGYGQHAEHREPLLKKKSTYRQKKRSVPASA